MTRALALILALAWVSAAQAQSQEALRFLGQEGCAVGPDTVARAGAAGVDLTGIDAVAGGYELLSQDICQITLPVIADAPSLDDRDVLRSFLPHDDGTGAGPGCVLDRATFMDWMPLAKGWTALETVQAYNRMVAAGLISGDLRFYSDDLLATPPGVERITGPCAEVERLAPARASRGEIATWFGLFVRRAGQATPCRNGASMVLDADGFALLAEATEGTHKNAWLAFELWLIAYGAGWYEFDGPEDRGTPRPPACGLTP